MPSSSCACQQAACAPRKPCCVMGADRCLNPRPIVYSRPPVESDLLYAVAQGPNQTAAVYLVDPVSGESTLVVELPVVDVRALVIDPRTGNVYVLAESPDADASPADNTAYLYQVDLKDPNRFCAIGSTGYDEVYTAAFSPCGVLFGWDQAGDGDGLITIDLATGAGAAVGNLGNAQAGTAPGAIPSLSLDPSTGLLWLRGACTSGAFNMYEVDPVTGALALPAVVVQVEDSTECPREGFAIGAACDIAFSVINVGDSGPALLRFVAGSNDNAVIGESIVERCSGLALQGITSLVFSPPAHSRQCMGGRVCYKRRGLGGVYGAAPY